jgi:hypothetical protein
MALLYRALNTKCLIAFVGSGVSAAYGLVGWAELALFHARRLRDLVSSLAETDPRATFLSQLRSVTHSGRNLPGDQIMTAPMLCEQIWHLTPTAADLDKLADRFDLRDRLEKLQASNRVKGTEWGKDLFRTWIKRETHDELGHLLRVLSRIQHNEKGPRETDRSHSGTHGALRTAVTSLQHRGHITASSALVPG